MTHDEFEAVVAATVQHLPAHILEALHNVEFLVMDRPDERLDPGGDGLLGLYEGIPLPDRGVNYAGVLPDVIYLFRLPHLALNLPADELRQEIARTVMHEIAHYFGIDDNDLEEIGWG